MKEYINNNGLECLVVIGSHARGDDDKFSDVDFLGIVKKNIHDMVNVNKINLSVYSEKYMRAMMKQGDLFALHVVKEGIPLVNASLFEDICACFKYKDSYEKERQMAFLMAAMILKQKKDISNWQITNRRITWAVRTYILSLMAESRSPVFGKEEIALFGHFIHESVSYEDFLILINAKQRSGYSKVTLDVLNRFLPLLENYRPNSEKADELYRTESILQNTFERMMFDSYR